MTAKSGSGYSARFGNGGTAIRVAVRKDLGDRQLESLRADLVRMSSGIGPGRSIIFELSLPLTHSLERCLWMLSQELELPAILSLAPFPEPDQSAFGAEYLKPTRRWLRVEVPRPQAEER